MQFNAREELLAAAPPCRCRDVTVAMLNFALRRFDVDHMHYNEAARARTRAVASRIILINVMHNGSFNLEVEDDWIITSRRVKNQSGKKPVVKKSDDWFFISR